MEEKRIHVYHSNGVWKVRRSDSEKASRAFDDKTEAIQYGQEQERKKKIELFVHNVDGSINENHQYKSDMIATIV